MGKFESYPSINNLDDDDITLYNHDTITHKVSFLRLANLIKLRVADQIPTQGSDNLVSSGGIYNALQSKADKATTLDGYGIEDAYNMQESNIRFLQKQDINPNNWDNTPTNGSNKPVTSNGINEALNTKLDNYSSDSTQWDTAPQSHSNKPVTSDGIKSSIGNSINLLAENTIKNGACNIMPYPYNGFLTGRVHSLEVLPTGEIYIDYEAGYEFTYYLTKCSGNNAKPDVCQELCETLKNGAYVLYGIDDEYLKLMVDYYDASLNFISSQWANDGAHIRLQVPSSAKYVQVSIKADINHDFDDYINPSICLESFFESVNSTPFAPCTKNNYQLSRALSVWNNDVATDFYFDYQNGKYGWNSSPLRGADTFHPFRQAATETNVQDEINGLKNSVAEKLPTYESDSSFWDTLPIENSTKPITSGGVFASLPQMSYVGMIIHSTTLDTEAKVKAFYGGTTWTKIEGRFLLGTSSSHAINTTGGSETVTLTINQIPSHSHSLVPNTTNTAIYTGTGRYDNTETSGGRNHIVNNNTGATGGGQAHDNMPPFRSVYIWVRTA